MKTDHCLFCDNKIVDFSKGTLCTLTSEKPNFENICPSITLEKTFEEKIKDINIGN